MFLPLALDKQRNDLSGVGRTRVQQVGEGANFTEISEDRRRGVSTAIPRRGAPHGGELGQAAGAAAEAVSQWCHLVSDEGGRSLTAPALFLAMSSGSGMTPRIVSQLGQTAV
jgi:hypothetical protein